MKLGNAVRLQEVLLNRRWMMFAEPFRYMIVQDVFVPQLYKKLEDAFQGVLDKGLSDTPNKNKFSRNMGNYDAFSVAIPQEAPFDVFLSQEMHDLLNDMFDVDSTGDLAGSLHTHKVGSRSGFIHNDLNPARFPARKANDRSVFYNPSAYEMSGLAQGPNERTVMRAVAVLYYLNNGTWSPGDGGETGLYSYSKQDVQYPTARVPPINNLMMAFECTPFSYHAFMSNIRRTRNTVIFWLHNEYDESVKRWGETNFVFWDK